MMRAPVEPSLRWRVRFGQIFAARLEAQGIDPRDWLLFHPREDDLLSLDEAIFGELDLRVQSDRWEKLFAPAARGRIPDFEDETLRLMRARFTLFVLGGLGSHMIRNKALEEALEFNEGGDPWVYPIDYGNSLASTGQCAQQAADRCLRILRRPENASRRALFLGHSKGANVILEMMLQPPLRDLRDRTAYVVSASGAIGGSPAADSLLGKAVSGSERAPKVLRDGMKNAMRAIAQRATHPFLANLHSIEELPVGVRELSQQARHAFLNSARLPESVRFLSIAGAIERSRVRPKGFMNLDIDQNLKFLGTYELARHGALNDTQLLLHDAKWPPAPNAHHIATLRVDHWGIAYRQVLSSGPPDPAPRKTMLEAALTVAYEMEKER